MSELYELFSQHPRISTDTRRIVPGSVFFALRGATFDGNRFVAEALARGAAFAVADDPAAAGGDPRIRFVPDTLQALQALAREHRRALGIPILAISGSNGKTTTKELVSRVLASRFEVYATRGNLNNHIGVPLTLLAMDARTQFGIVEMGASACGEIALLASVAEPDYGLLTNVGRAHLEGFGGPEGVRRGKGELFDYLAAHGGTAFVPEEDATLSAMAAERPAMAVERYSRSLADGLENRLEGSYNRYNIAAAVAVGHRFGIPDGEIRRAIASYTPDNNRSQRIGTSRNTLVADCYNANPQSMSAALRVLAASEGKKIAVLGDMKELGELTESAHRAMGELCALLGIDRVIAVGEYARGIADAAHESAAWYPDAESAVDAARAAFTEGSVLLCKASHSMHLEKIVEELLKTT